MTAYSTRMLVMIRSGGALPCALCMVLALAAGAYQSIDAQVSKDPLADSVSAAKLGLSESQSQQLQSFLSRQDYIGAQRILLPEIEKDPHTPRTADLLEFLGSVYFLNRDFMNAAIAWKRVEALRPLKPSLRFSQAMTYVEMGHADWAEKVLQSLSADEPKKALYPYWLGRLEYDGHRYKSAIMNFQHAIELDPSMGRAYDNLGLCYYYENENEKAVANFRHAIELGKGAANPSPWPYLNLAITQQFLNQSNEAELNLREALRLDPKFAQAHFQLGTVLEDSGRLQEAVAELKEAARLNPEYAEPHMALARVDHKLGRQAEARDEVNIYKKLHPPAVPSGGPRQQFPQP